MFARHCEFSYDVLRNVFVVMKYVVQARVVFCASKDARFHFHGLHKDFLLLLMYVPESALYK